MPTPQIPMSEHQPIFFRDSLLPITSRGIEVGIRLLNVHLEFGDEDREMVFNHLIDGGSILMISNHRSHIDEGILINDVIGQFQGWGQEIAAIAGTKLYPDYYHNLDLPPEQIKTILIEFAGQIEAHRQSANRTEGSLLRAMAARLGVTLIPIVQEENLGEGEWGRLNRSLSVNAMDAFE